jgi:hypothetical protein
MNGKAGKAMIDLWTGLVHEMVNNVMMLLSDADVKIKKKRKKGRGRKKRDANERKRKKKKQRKLQLKQVSGGL